MADLVCMKNTTFILKTFVVASTLNLFLGTSVHAMSKRAPKSEPSQQQKPPSQSAPTPPVAREPAAILDRLTPSGFDPYFEVGVTEGQAVDAIYRQNRELMPVRNAQESHYTDSCDPGLDRKDSFAERIAHAVELKMQPSVAQVSYVGSLFGMSNDASTYLPNSLISHPICRVSRSTLETTFGGKNIPSDATIAKANRFAELMNSYRREALAGSRDGYTKASQLWGKFFMCLSYMESLTTADTNKSYNVASKYAPSGFRKPAGVNFYEDPNQPAESRLNIGLYQFTPNAGGNIQACLREWNQVYPRCGINPKASQSELIRILGSSLQTFNAFCAAAKTTGMFSVQINTRKAYNTHPANVASNGSLKASVDRCVSPHMNVGRSYNHFGPFQNVAGFTMDTILSCTLRDE